MKHLPFCLASAIAMISISQGNAQVLYGATASGQPGTLFTLNPATGAMISTIGPLNDASSVNYPITGLAFHPVTGVLYGSTGNSVAATAAKLVTINPTTGLVTVVGSFNAGPVSGGGTPATMADIAFDAAGNLYGVGSIGGPQIYSINTSTAQATVIGTTGITSTTGGGLAISSGGTFFGTPTAARFGTYNSTTGAFTNITAPFLPGGGSYAALEFNGSTLYGLNSGSPISGVNPTHLVTFDQTTGAVTDLGSSVNFLDAIAFSPTPIPEPGSMLLVGAPAIVGLFLNRRRRKASSRIDAGQRD